VVFAVVLSQALSLAGVIAAAIRLPRRSAPAVATEAKAPPLWPAAEAVPNRAAAIAAMAQAPPPVAAGASPRSGTLVAASLTEAPAARPVPVADYAGRLGQASRSTAPRTGFAAELRPLIK
jgi:hypothetical protein